MPTRSYIAIGSDQRVPLTALQVIVDAAQSDWARDASADAPPGSAEELRAMIPAQGPLLLYGDDLPLANLEDACRDQGLTFYEWYHHPDALIPSATFWRPGMDRPEWVWTDDDGEPMLPLSVLREAVRRGETVATLVDLEERMVQAVPPFRLSL
jgi:hypothetical protein